MLTHASADGAGQPRGAVRLARPGRDGIGGASVLASATFGDQDPSKRPRVQVGDPFAEKLLIEATLELIAKGLVGRHPGPRRGRHHLRDLRDRGPRRHRDPRRPRRDPAPRARPRAVRGHDLRVAGADGRDRRAAPLGGRARPSASAGTCPVAVIGRVTVEPDIVVLTGPDGRGALDADGRPVAGARRARPDARPRPRVRGDRVRARVPRADPAPRGPGPRRPGRARGHAAAARPGPGRRAAGPARLAEPLVAPPGLRAVRLQRPVQHRRGPGRGAAVLRIKGTTKALVATTDGNAPVGALDPWLGAAMSVAEAARNVSITGARPLGVTNCLNYGDPTRPEAFWQLDRGRPRPRRRVRGPRPAGHRRQRLALQRGARLRDRADARDRHRGAARRRRDARRPGVPRGRQRGPARRRGRARPRGLRVRAPRRRRRPRTARRRSTSRARRGSRRSSARPSPAASSRAARTCRAAASRSRSPRWHLGRPRRAAPARRRRLAGRRPVRREPVAPRVRGRPAPRAGVRAARPPARPARRGARDDRRLAPPRRARRRGRHGRRGGAGEPDRGRHRRLGRRPAPRVGARAPAGPRLGRRPA